MTVATHDEPPVLVTRTDDPDVAPPPLTVGEVELTNVLSAGERIVSDHVPGQIGFRLVLRLKRSPWNRMSPLLWVVARP